jgi:hypothetical protein
MRCLNGHETVGTCGGKAIRALAHADALATLIDRERASCCSWIGMPEAILKLLNLNFQPVRQNVRFGKIEYVGIRL